MILSLLFYLKSFLSAFWTGLTWGLFIKAQPIEKPHQQSIQPFLNEFQRRQVNPRSYNVHLPFLLWERLEHLATASALEGQCYKLITHLLYAHRINSLAFQSI